MGITMTTKGRSGKPGRPTFFPIRAHLLTTCEAGGGIPPSRSGRALCEADCALCGERQTMPQRIPAVIVCAVGRRLSPCLPLRCKPLSSFGTTCHPPAKTCHRQLSRSYGRCLPCTVHFLLPRQKKQNRPLQGAEGT